jgi:hypothetical protein
LWVKHVIDILVGAKCFECLFGLDFPLHGALLFKTGVDCHPGPVGAMSTDVVQKALAAAAARAQRHAELNSAASVMERLLNFALSPEMLPWGTAMLHADFI